MSEENYRSQLLNITAISAEFCSAVENVADSPRHEFVMTILNLLPRIYVGFLDLSPENSAIEEDNYFNNTYIDEDYYDSVRRRMEGVMGSEDTFLETFEEDMKYSDTPIAASVSESLADIFQSLYNFVSAVRESDGELLMESYIRCREDFDEYWSQTLCNVLRALNHIRRNISEEE